MRRGRRLVGLGTVSLASLMLLAGSPPATAAEPPSVRMFAATSHIDAQRNRHDLSWFDPGIWVASVGGAFELRVSRPDYDTPVSIVQTDASTGEVLRTLPAELLDGWLGLDDFIHISVQDPAGHTVYRQSLTFCPNSYARARLSDEGPLSSVYPYSCGGNPFTRGTVWGIEDHWAVGASSDYGFQFHAPRRHYRLRAWIDPAWVDALGLAPEDAEAFATITVRDAGGGGGAPPPVLTPGSAFAPGPRVPTVSDPDPATLPDLVALPAWGFDTYTRNGRDFLTFNATEWNSGPGTMVVEGFRGVDEPMMDAYQYFLQDGVAVGRAPIGQLEYHTQHQHWHFRQFTEYSILDADSGQIAVSGKESWCLANTDAIDLSVPNANWAGYGSDVFTMCGGGPGALWIREVLDVGWGDTYTQYIAGQAFDITDLPNGDYYVRVRVNPLGSMFETTTDNDVQDRLVKLRGRPGERRVVVPPWHGIDTEGGCTFCG